MLEALHQVVTYSNQLYSYCGTTDKVTSQDFPSCEFAYCSFIFAIMTGFCIGTLALSNIIGLAYVNKKLSLGQLVFISCVFEVLGMLTISRYTLKTTVTKTIMLSEITNLRRSFIALGSTQMCSAFMMINVLIFSLPMSST
jgi:phosphate/sulfate permease